MTDAFEVNFDGLPGLTHNYSGLSFGNLASMNNRKLASNPRAAALQALAKMKFMMDLGQKQAIIPPQERPDIQTLKRLGFLGTDREILERVGKQEFGILATCSSSSSMWTANMATVCPSADSVDNKLHITPANLTYSFHRSIEVSTTIKILRSIFASSESFAIHNPLPSHSLFADEGAANHNRFCKSHGDAGVQLFVYGRNGKDDAVSGRIFPARQTLDASKAIARLHNIPDQQCLFVQQNPDAINAGVFHNDVISLAHKNVFLYHEKAFVETERLLANLRERVHDKCLSNLISIKINSNQLSFDGAVNSYLFNSQLVSLNDGNMVLVSPTECEEIGEAKDCIDMIIGDKENPISTVYFINVRESMKNGGGTGCLRLRVVMNESEFATMNQGVLLTTKLFNDLSIFINRHYRDHFTPDDLLDSDLIIESQTALDKLSKLLNLGNIYSFQD